MKFNLNHKLKFYRMELSGAFGDLGTLVPLFTGLVAINGLNTNVTLFWVGLLYIFCGFYYKLPIPVQPLKAAAAIVISQSLNLNLISATGILIGTILIVLTVTRITDLLTRVFTQPIVRGIQLGVGLILIKASGLLIYKSVAMDNTITWLGTTINADWLIISFGLMVLLITFRYKQFPAALVLVVGGIVISIGYLPSRSFPIFNPAIPPLKFVLPSLPELWTALVVLVIPQLPLTLGNSIVSTTELAHRYYGNRANRVSVRSLSLDLGITNLITGLTGAMPLCHGSGGLTAHYQFGARSGIANLYIGILCLFLSVVFGTGINELFKFIPYSILGLMLFYVGWIHTRLVTDFQTIPELILAIGIGIISLITNNITVGIGVGLIGKYIGQLIKFRTG